MWTFFAVTHAAPRIIRAGLPLCHKEGGRQHEEWAELHVQAPRRQEKREVRAALTAVCSEGRAPRARCFALNGLGRARRSPRVSPSAAPAGTPRAIERDRHDLAQFAWVQPGDIIVRQRGTSKYPGDNVGLGRDHTIWSLVHGRVQFQLRTWTPKHLAAAPSSCAGHPRDETDPSSLGACTAARTPARPAVDPIRKGGRRRAVLFRTIRRSARHAAHAVPSTVERARAVSRT